MLTLLHLIILTIIFPMLFILLIQQSYAQIPPNSVFIPPNQVTTLMLVIPMYSMPLLMRAFFAYSSGNGYTLIRVKTLAVN